MFDLKSLNNTTWLAEPTRFKQLLEAASRREVPSARRIEKERAKRMDAAKHAAAKAVRAVKGRVAVIPIYGFIEQHMTFMTYMMGGTCCDEISMQLDAVLADPSVNAVVFHVDSPGGGVYGIEELSDKIYNARAKKPCYSIADSEACSAAYWLATAAQTVCCTPGGMVGSVGVFSVHLDRSKELEQAGIKVTLIKAGKRKAEGFPSEPLDEDARASMQDSVNETYGKFIDALARNRHDVSKADVREKFGQGGVVSADAALAAKMIDRVCSFEDLMQRLTGYAGTGSPSNMAAVNMLKLRQDQRERETEFMLDDEE